MGEHIPQDVTAGQVPPVLLSPEHWVTSRATRHHRR